MKDIIAGSGGSATQTSIDYLESRIKKVEEGIFFLKMLLLWGFIILFIAMIVMTA